LLSVSGLRQKYKELKEYKGFKGIKMISIAVVFIGLAMVMACAKTIPITVVDGLREYSMRIPLLTEAGALRAAGITLGPKDYVTTARVTVSEGPRLIMKVNRITQSLLVERTELKSATVLKPVYYLPVGRQRVVQKGYPGIKEVTWQITYHNRHGVSREKLSSAIVKYPQNRIVVYGAAVSNKRAAREKPPTEFRQELILEATGYTHTGNPTFTGIYPFRGIMAVDPKVFPLGTLMWVEGYGYARAADTGRLVKGNIIDLFFDTRDEAIEWGRRQVRAFVIANY
jgi:3D (Asp-Asp-Asp) domain-containing protein